MTTNDKTAFLDDFDKSVLTERGVSAEIAKAAKWRTETDPKVISERVGWRWRQSDGPVMLIPFFGPDGEPMQFGQVRPQRPKTNQKTGKPLKYLTPKGAASRVYFPPNVRADVLGNKDILLVITEGPLKSLAAATFGYYAVALTGVWNSGKPREKDANGQNIGPMELCDDLAGIALEGRLIIICFDSDSVKNESVRAAEIMLAKMLAARGAIVKIARLPEEEDGKKNGLDDYLMRHGKDAFDAILAEAKPPAAAAKPVVHITTSEHRVAEEVIAGLCADEELFHRNGAFVRVREDDETGAVTTPPVEPADMRRRITEQCFLLGIPQNAKSDEPKPVHPPPWLPPMVLDHPDPAGIRRLIGVYSVPILRPDGSIHSKPGYDAATKCYYHPRGLIVPALGTLARADAIAASASLLGIIDDFPITDDAGKSVWLSLILSTIGRHLTPGSVPGHLITANVRGSGKGKAATCASIIAAGSAMPCQAYTTDAAEMRKLLTSVVLAGGSMLCFDNLESGGTLGGAVLDMVLTSGRHMDRLLGGNRYIDAPFRAVVSATGNNVVTSHDAARRWMTCSMDSPTATPEDRSDFRHPNLEAHVRANRGQYVADALTILAAYMQAGRPDMKLGPTGSFQDWSDLVRSAIVWAGGADPWATVTNRRSSSDAEANEHLALVRAWDSLDPDCIGLAVAAAKKRYESAQSVMDNSYIASNYGPVDDLIAECGMKGFDTRRIGAILKKHKDRPTPDGRRIVSRTGQGGLCVWRVSARPATTDEGGSGGSGGSVSRPHNIENPANQKTAYGDRANGDPPKPPDPPTTNGKAGPRRYGSSDMRGCRP